MGTKRKCLLCFFLLATTTQVYIAESNNHSSNSFDVSGFRNHSDTNWNDHSAQNVFSDANTIDETTQNKPSDLNDMVTIKAADTTQRTLFHVTKMTNSTLIPLFDTIDIDYSSEITSYDNSEHVNVTQTAHYGTYESVNVETDVSNTTTATLSHFHEMVNATSSGMGDMYLVYLPFGVISVAGSIMIIIIMSTSDNRGKSTSFLFTVLAISDTSLTINNMLYACLQGANVASFTEGRPLIFGIITNLIWRINVHFSNYVLVVITLERVISIALPLQVKTICKRKHLLVTIAIILVVLAVANIPLWIRDWPSVIMGNLELVDLVLGFFVPFLTITVGGIYIIVKVKYGHGLLSSSPYNSSVTNVVLGTILAFLVTMLPRRIIYLIETGRSDGEQSEFLIILCQGLESINTGVNFFVYILAGRKFREDFVNLVLRRTKNGSSRSVSTKSTNSKSKYTE